MVPRISLVETFTDNAAPASQVKRSDQITQIVPGIRLDSDSARLKFHLDYQLREVLYAQQSGRRDTQNYLNSFGTLEAIDKWLFVDVTGIVTQQETNPFRIQSASNVTVNPNRVETSSFRVSPYIRGRLLASADYELRYNRSSTHSDSTTLVSNVDTEEWRANIKGMTPLSVLGWGLDASHQNIDYSNGKNSDSDRLRGLLSYQINPEFKVSASGGREANNFVSVDKEFHTTHGYGFDWLPSPRTYVSAFKEKRFFGDGHTISAGYRTPLSALRFTDTRDVSVLPNRLTTVGFGNIHDLIFTQMASSIPDEAERNRAVDELLQRNGLSPDLVVTTGFLTSRVTVLRRQELSYSLQGRRDVLTFAAVRSEQEGLGASTGQNDIFATARNIRQRGFSVNLSHRLTPLSSVSVLASQQNNNSTAASDLSSELKSLYVNFSTKLGPQTTATLGVRRALFEGSILSYSENALIGSVSAQF